MNKENILYKELLNTAVEAARLAGEIQEKHLGQKRGVLRRKEHYDIVTEVDYLCERSIISAVKGRFPEHAVISEETRQPYSESNEYLWIIDPLDGTINYTSGVPFFATSIAVQRLGKTIIGVVYAPALDELYTVIRGKGAFLNWKPIHVSATSRLSDSVLSLMLTSHYSISEVEKATMILRGLASRTRGIRVLVSQSIELGYIASGRMEGHICIKSRGFSSAAGKLLVAEAGGKVTDIRGASFEANSRSLVISNGKVHEAIVETIKEALK